MPAALEVIVNDAQQHFRSRAASTLLVVAAWGNPLELVLASLYFVEPFEAVLKLEQLQWIEQQQVGLAIPLHSRFAARDRLRMKATGVPQETRFQTRHAQALEMLAEQGHLLPHA